MKRVLVIVLIGFLASLTAYNITLSKADQLTRVPIPKVPIGKGETCVRETEFMRTDHMTLLFHQRDQTVHQGIRPERTAFNECLTCHAVYGLDAKPVTYKDPKHFCRACHDYAAVSIDCFSCHNSAPEVSEVAGK